MRTEFGARPNFTCQPELLDYLYIGVIFSEKPYDDLKKLLQQCSKLSTIGFDSVYFLGFILGNVIRGHLSLPLLRVIRIDFYDFAMREFNDRLIVRLVEYEESIKPERLQIFVFDQQIDLDRFMEIIRLVSSFDIKDINSRDLSFDPFNEHEILGCLHLSRLCYAINETTELDEELMMKFKNLKTFYIKRGSPLIDEGLFKKMLSTWTQLELFKIKEQNYKLGQHQLEMMPSYWPNLCVLNLSKKPENLKFVVDFKNLRVLDVWFSLPREETMFLMGACPSLYFLCFFNESTQYEIDLFTNRYMRYAKDHKNLFEIGMRKLFEVNPGKEYRCEFSSLEKLIDYFYKNDLFNKPPSISMASKLKNQLKKKLHLSVGRR